MDKKGWIIIALCLAGLALNSWWGGQQREKALAEQRAKAAQMPAPVPGAPAATAGDTPGAVETPKVELVNTPPKPAFEEKESVLEWTDARTKTSVRYVFTNRGGGLKRVEFPSDPVHADASDPVTLNRGGPYAAGALSDGLGRVEAGEYRVVESSADRIVLEGLSFSGVAVRKEYHLRPGAPGTYPIVDLSLTLTNPGATEANLATWFLYLGSTMPLLADEYDAQTGVAWLDGDSAKLKPVGQFKGGWFSSARDHLTDRLAQPRWFALLNQFYAVMALPADSAPRDWWAQPIHLDVPGRRNGEKKDRMGVQGAIGLGAAPLAPGATQAIAWRFFFGPKSYDGLKKLEKADAPDTGIRQVMLYSDMPVFGWMAAPFSKGLNWLMHRIKSLVPDYGVAIIILTILIRFAIWPLHARAQNTMKRMSLLNPMLQELRTKYESDPQRMNQEMMKLYRDYGINPLGGCLPIFLQMPIFFGFYRMLQYAAELRHENFLWVKDLSQPDTLFYIANIPVNALPLVMAVTMVIQMRMTPQAGDPTQRRIFALMPFVFLFICYNFASALSLYWTTTNIFSIGQSWWMKRLPEPKLEKKKRVSRANLEEMRRRMSGGPEKDAKPKNRPPRTGG